MIARIVAWSLAHRLAVCIGVLVLTLAGLRAFHNLSVDAVPDITNVQVQVLTNAPGLSPLEVEQLVTRPVELAMAGTPGVETMRSTSRASVSAVTLVFSDAVDLSAARALVSQRLPNAREAIPASAKRPEMGPMTTGLGEVFQFTLSWPGHSDRDLRTLFDWEVAQGLRTVPGIVEVNAWGGRSRQIEVRLRPADMQARGVTQAEVESTLLEGGQNAGGGSLERREEQVSVRFDGQYRTAEQVGEQVVRTARSGVSVRIQDVAQVVEGEAFRASSATADGNGETVFAMAQMIAGGNAQEVIPRVEARLDEIRKRLPEGVRIEPFYVRTTLVQKVLGTVSRSLIEGGLVVVLVLFLFLGNVRAALVVASVIPLAMLGAFVCMQGLGISGNLMSLGAVDFGLVVDGSVVVIEGALATMVARKISMREALEHEGRTVGSAIAFGVSIIACVYVPVLLLEGVEGKMFRPMVLTVLFALGTAMVLTFTWVPVAASALIRKVSEHENRFVATLRQFYEPLLRACMHSPRISIGIAGLMVALGVAAGATRGTEFVPRLEEGDLVIQLTRPPSVSQTESIAGTTAVEQTLRAFPEVKRVISRTGSPDVATDIMGIDQSDIFVILEPPERWTRAHSREALIGLFEAELRKSLPGSAFNFTQPIEMRSQELLGGLKSDVGVKVFGDDLPTLTRLAHEVELALAATQGASDIRVEPTTGLALLTVEPDTDALGRRGIRTQDLRMAIEAIRAGRTAGVLVEGERRFDIAVRLDAPPSADMESLAGVALPLGDGKSVSLGEVSRMRRSEGPAQISRELGRRRVLVEANVRGRDLGSFVSELQRRLEGVGRPAGYFFAIAGQYENLQRASARLALVVPLTLVGIFGLLYFTFHKLRPAVLIFLNIPAAASGGVLALAARGMPFSISAAVGFVALFGVATMNGIVLLSAIQAREAAGDGAFEAARQAARERLRPVLTTALVAGLGFLPMAMATGTGAEVQRPLATVVMGGLLSATVLTLLVLPSLYAYWMNRADTPPPSPTT